VSDEIHRLSDELAHDPSSLAFLRLAELLRRSGDLGAAERVAQRGRDRHPGLAAAHDLTARIAADRGDAAAAEESWRTVLRLMPAHAGANKGLGFLAYRTGRLREAEDHLTRAARGNPDDGTIAAALATVQSELAAAVPAPPAVAQPAPRPEVAAPAPPAAEPEARAETGASLFAGLSADADALLLVDRDGLVLAGTAPGGQSEREAELGAHLSGVSDEAERAMRHLELGAWRAIVIEAPGASVALAPADGDAVVVVAAPRTAPLGLVRRVLDRATHRARGWLGAGA
jgi:predicted regulator of Ras-like GTPase activity (Roadblock/LC7/MglB family)